MQILVENTTTHFKQYYDDIDIKHGKIYIQTDIDLKELVDGEYMIYLLNNSNEIITSDLLKIGDYVIENNKLKSFKQYGRK